MAYIAVSMSFLILSVFSLLSLTDVANGSHHPHGLVTEVCSKQTNKTFCEEVLRSDHKSALAKDSYTLWQIAINVAVARTTRTRYHFLRLVEAKEKSREENIVKPLRECITAYHGVIKDLKDTLLIKEETMIGYPLGTAYDQAEWCKDVLKGKFVKDADILDKSKTVDDLVRLCLTLSVPIPKH